MTPTERIEKLLAEMEARASESVEIRMGGKRIEKEFGLPALERDIPRLIAALRDVLHQDRARGYPTGTEWINLLSDIADALEGRR